MARVGARVGARERAHARTRLGNRAGARQRARKTGIGRLVELQLASGVHQQRTLQRTDRTRQRAGVHDGAARIAVRTSQREGASALLGEAARTRDHTRIGGAGIAAARRQRSTENHRATRTGKTADRLGRRNIENTRRRHHNRPTVHQRRTTSQTQRPTRYRRHTRVDVWARQGGDGGCRRRRH